MRRALASRTMDVHLRTVVKPEFWRATLSRYLILLSPRRQRSPVSSLRQRRGTPDPPVKPGRFNLLLDLSVARADGLAWVRDLEDHAAFFGAEGSVGFARGAARVVAFGEPAIEGVVV
jgi:hypothetical protein